MATDRTKLLQAYAVIMLQHMRGAIGREERNARIVALRESPAAAGLSFKERDAIANEAVEQVTDMLDEVHFEGGGGRWQ